MSLGGEGCTSRDRSVGGGRGLPSVKSVGWGVWVGSRSHPSRMLGATPATKSPAPALSATVSAIGPGSCPPRTARIDAAFSMRSPPLRSAMVLLRRPDDRMVLLVYYY